MTFIQKPNSGQFFKNTKKNKDTDPDLTGSCNTEKVDENGEVIRKEFWVSGWNNTSKESGKKYINFKLNIKKPVYPPKKDEPKEEKSFVEQPMDDDIPF